jgi:small subunit ribosomal protein S21e
LCFFSSFFYVNLTKKKNKNFLLLLNISDLLKMQNTDSAPTTEQIELYVPRKCAASNKIIAAKDHAAVQLDIAEVDEQTGRITGKYRTYALCGSIRMMGEADDSIVRLAAKDGFIGRGYYTKDTK